MARPKGSRNEDFAASRAALVTKLRHALLGLAPPSSLRGLAEAAEVSVPTLRHYFGDKDAVLAAVFADCHDGGAAELLAAATPQGDFRHSVQDLVRHIAGGFEHGRLDRLHAVGLVEGLVEAGVGAAYLSSILEPTLDAVAQRLARHMAMGEMRPVPPRQAALSLLAPILLLYLHQRGLGGLRSHPTDITAFLHMHAEGFFLGFAQAPAQPPQGSGEPVAPQRGPGRRPGFP